MNIAAIALDQAEVEISLNRWKENKQETWLIDYLSYVNGLGFSTAISDLRLLLSEILMVNETDGSQFILFTLETGRVVQVRALLNSLDFMLRKHHFVQVTKGCYINLIHVKLFDMGNKRISLDNGCVITSEPEFYIELLATFQRFLPLTK